MIRISSGVKQQIYLVTGLALLAIMSAAQANEAGKQLYDAQCKHCHTLDPAAPAIVGPHLADLAGRAAASVENYGVRYSPALVARGEQGMSWDEETLDAFLEAPQASVAGTIMGYPGMSSADDRAALIAYLMSEGLAEQAEAPVVDPEVERILAMDADQAYGEYLSGECLTCHQSDVSEGGVPPINNLPRSYFIQALLEYRSGDRINDVMQLMATNTGDEEVAALSAYFAPSE